MNDINISAIKESICEIISASTNFEVRELLGRESEHLHKDLGIDSLTLLEIALSVDQEFGTDFSEDELLGMESVDAATNMVADRLKKLKSKSAD